MIFGVVTPLMEKTKYLLPALASTQFSQHTIVHEVQQCNQGIEFILPEEFCGRVRIVREADTGMYDAITKGFDRICAQHPEVEILSWLNSDEQYLVGAIDIVAEFFREHPDVDVVYGDYIQLDIDGKPCSVRREISPCLLYLTHGVNYIMSCTVFIRRHVWEQGAKLDTSYKFLADKKFYIANLRNGYRFVHLPILLGAYTTTGQNLSLQYNATLEEQIRLRGELKSWCLPLRKLVRFLRCVSKFLSGCYRNNFVCFTYLNQKCELCQFNGKISNRWK